MQLDSSAWCTHAVWAAAARSHLRAKVVGRSIGEQHRAEDNSHDQTRSNLTCFLGLELLLGRLLNAQRASALSLTESQPGTPDNGHQRSGTLGSAGGSSETHYCTEVPSCWCLSRS